MRIDESSQAFRLARHVAGQYAALAQVEAVALGGSLASGRADQASDIDMYVYVRGEIPLDARAAIARPGARRAEVGNTFWEPGDEWVDAQSGIGVDAMFRRTGWIEEQLDRVLHRHEASVGYTTCLWDNVRAAYPLYDRDGWFGALQSSARRPYPEPLVRAIVAKNYPILRNTISSYRHQLERAIAHADAVSVNHRTAALLASYFDILFAVNRRTHPGEKRLIEIAEDECPRRPEAMAEQVRALVHAAGQMDGELIERADELVDGLEHLLRAQGLVE